MRSPRLPDSAALAAFAEGRRAEENLPGVALAVFAGGEVPFRAAWGTADVAGGTPLTPATLFRAGSLTKLATVAAALRLAERGVLALDDPAARHLPWLDGTPAGAPAVTLRRLLSHRAGLARGPYGRVPFDDARLRELADAPPAFAPGERFKYSNLGFGLAARALAAAAGRPWTELARREVLEPAGASPCRLAGEPPAPGEATGYQRGHYRSLVRRGDALEPAPALAAPAGAGDLLASAEGYARLLAALWGAQPSPLLGAGALAELAAPQGAADPDTGNDWGLGVCLARRLGRPCLLQNGGSAGFFALWIVFPAERVGGVALANRCAAHHPLADLLDRAVAPLLPGAARPAPGQPLWPFAGRYRGTRGELELRAGGGALELLWQGETAPLLRHGRGRFVQQRGPFSEHLLRLEAAGGLAWEATTGPLRWLREGAGGALAWEGPVDAGPPAGKGSAADRVGRGLAGVFTHPDFGDVRVYPRGGDLLFAPYYAEETRLLPQGRRRFRVAGGFLAGEEVVFAPAAGEAATLATGGMRFARRPLRPEDLQ